jgi:hypothetical protein
MQKIIAKTIKTIRAIRPTNKGLFVFQRISSFCEKLTFALAEVIDGTLDIT